MTLVVSSPRRLQRDDEREGFACGAPELDEWLLKYAWQNQQRLSAISYVTTYEKRVVGYYALAVASYSRGLVPQRVAAGMPNLIPCMLVARLAVDSTMHSQGIGAALLRDALRRSALLSHHVGAAAVLVHCRDESARQFYLANGNFLPVPLAPMHLIVSMTDVIKLSRG